MITPINVKEEAFDLGVNKALLSGLFENVAGNLRHQLFDWQREAVEALILKWEVHKKQQQAENLHLPLHLMFNMATGTGKTLVMAAAMLYFYREGYRHFLFFVNRNNIVDKTENNFCNPAHGKYLFADSIKIKGEQVSVRKVENFEDAAEDIQIKFISMQKLHNDIHVQRENQTTLDELHRRKIVMLADEAHHLNADTRGQAELAATGALSGRTAAAEVERRGWEHTVIKLLLQKNGKSENNRNVLLEFTATIPANDAIAQKYEGKLLYRFELKEFLRRGYTKEINLLSSTLPKKQRVLLALLLQWYRCQIALKHGIKNFKPVVLFRSRTIADSRADYAEFLSWMDAKEGIGGEDLTFIDEVAQKIGRDPLDANSPHDMGLSRLRQMLAHIADSGIAYADIARWLKTAYGPRHVIITNSQEQRRGDGKKEITDAATEDALNNLEHPANHIRAIFTVDRLTEGWDVLNLYDIVRLYQGANPIARRGDKTPEATVKEKQLIGRGVRYWPFAYGDAIAHKRKFDADMAHDLRALEELFFHTYDEQSRYIGHLKEELRRDGYIVENRVVQEFALKPEFANSAFYRRAKIWVNKPIPNPNRRRKTLADIVAREVEYRLPALALDEQAMNMQDGQDRQRAYVETGAATFIHKRVGEMEKHIFDKAINIRAAQVGRLCSFDEMRRVADIASMDELQRDKLANVIIRFIVARGMTYDDIANRDKLHAALKVLDAVTGELKRHDAPRIGGDFVREPLSRYFTEPKIKMVDAGGLEGAIARFEWYALNAFAGTSEEKALVQFVADAFGKLADKYEDIYLLKNEEVYKIYDFANSRGFCPDFLLFLRGKCMSPGLAQTEPRQVRVCYQVLIEPKGDQFRGADGSFASGKDGWKNDFLHEIRRRYGDTAVIDENQGYRLIGLPFYNVREDQTGRGNFREAFEETLLGAPPSAREE